MSRSRNTLMELERQAGGRRAGKRRGEPDGANGPTSSLRRLHDELGRRPGQRPFGGSAAFGLGPPAVPLGAAPLTAGSYDPGGPIHLSYRRETFGEPPVTAAARPWPEAAEIGPFAGGEPYVVEAFDEVADAGASLSPAEGSVTGASPGSTAAPAGAAPPAARPSPAEEEIDRDLETIRRQAPAPVPATEPAAAGPSAPSPVPRAASAEPSADPAPAVHPHAMFDRDLSFANTFDLGAVELSRRFDQFERELDREEEAPPAVGTPGTLSHPGELDDVELVSDLARIDEVLESTARQEEAAASPAPRTPPAAAAPQPSRRTAAPPDRVPDESQAPTTPAPRPPQTDRETPDSETPSGSTPPAEIRYTVPVVARSEKLSGPAAAAAMLVAWREGLQPESAEVAQGVGPWERFRDGLQAEGRSVLEIWGLTAIPAAADSPQAMREQLRDHGPIWAAAGRRARVVTGMATGRREAEVTVLFNDPAFEETESGRGSQPYRELIEQLRQPAAGEQAPELLMAHIEKRENPRERRHDQSTG